MAKREKVKKFKAGSSKGEILCAKHECSLKLRESGYGLYCPTCQKERERNLTTGGT